MDYPNGMRILLDITAGLEEQKVRDKLIELGWTPPLGPAGAQEPVGKVTTGFVSAHGDWRQELVLKKKEFLPSGTLLYTEAPAAVNEQLLKTLKAAIAFINSHAADPDITVEMQHYYAELLACKPNEVIAAAKAEQDKLDAARYRWLFGARTEDECKDWNVGMLPNKPQDLVIASVASTYMPKVAVDGEIDAAIAAVAEAEKAKGGV